MGVVSVVAGKIRQMKHDSRMKGGFAVESCKLLVCNMEVNMCSQNSTM